MGVAQSRFRCKFNQRESLKNSTKPIKGPTSLIVGRKITTSRFDSHMKWLYILEKVQCKILRNLPMAGSFQFAAQNRKRDTVCVHKEHADYNRDENYQ